MRTQTRLGRRLMRGPVAHVLLRGPATQPCSYAMRASAGQISAPAAISASILSGA